MNDSFVEAISFSKILSVAMGLDGRHILTRADVEIADKLLKRMANEAPYWNEFQKELFKLATDIVKEEMGGHRQW